MKKRLIALIFSIFSLAHVAVAEEVVVEYRGMVDLDFFVCEDVTWSSFIEQVCYDIANEYMLIEMNGAYYHYCEVDADTVDELMTAESAGKYYNRYIKSRNGDGPFDCRYRYVPEY